MKLRSNVDVLIHPLVFLHLNQMAFTRSEKSGARSRAGGLSERLDNLIAETATSGLPQKLKVCPFLFYGIQGSKPQQNNMHRLSRFY